MRSIMYGIIVFENLSFRPSIRKRQAAVFLRLGSRDRFRKPLFLVPENAIYVWTEG